MKQEFVNYLDAMGLVGLGGAMRGRVMQIYEFYEKIFKGEIEDIFVNDYATEDGSQEFTNLWFFTRTVCMEAKQFTMKDDFDAMPTDHIAYWKITKKNYDFEKATMASRIKLTFSTNITPWEGTLQASGKNCDYLRDIALKHILKNVGK